jgi:signal transduction histidine kinase
MKSCIWISSIFFSLFSLCALGKINTIPDDMDSLNYSYYQKILRTGYTSNSLHMADTLFLKGKKSRDSKAQCLALGCKLNYFYFKRELKDSTFYYIQALQSFARKVNRPMYYYFAYTRKINFYIKRLMINKAIVEAQQMLEEAKEEKYNQGIIESYKALSNIYLIKKEVNLSLRMIQKSIIYMKENKVDYRNAYILFLSASNLYLDLDSIEQAKLQLLNAKDYINNELQEAAIMLNKCIIASREYRFRTAERMLNTLSKIPSPIIQNKIKIARREYYIHLYLSGKKHQHLINYIKTKLRKEKSTTSRIYWLKKLSNAYALNGNHKQALNALKQSNKVKEAFISKIEQVNIAKANADLENTRLETEKKHLKTQIQQKTIAQLHTIILSGAFFILFSILFILLLKKRINQLHKTRQELIIAKNNIEHLNHLKTTFIRNVSHEIRTPLNQIAGFSNILADIYIDHEETKTYAEIIQKGTFQLTKAIDNLIDISALDNINKDLIEEEVDINHICAICIKEIESKKQKNVKLYFTPSQEKLLILSNSSAIKQILINLLTNACQFTKQGDIHLSSTIYKKKVILTVQDTGIGVSDKMKTVLYQRFSKEDTFKDGLGLGLSICQVLTLRLKGDIQLDDSYEKGARFKVYLPYKIMKRNKY